MIEIPLTQGFITIVDDEDSDLIQHKWIFSKNNCGQRGYVKRYKNVALHRVILERKLGRSLIKGEVCDHINGDTLDNRRGNLRVATIRQNLRNRGPSKKNSTGYKGVSWDKNSNKWVARITTNGRSLYLGCYSTPEKAYEAFCKQARILHGEFAHLD